MFKAQMHVKQVEPAITASHTACATSPVAATAWQRLILKLTARLQQPGDHWFFLLYLGGLAALLLLVSLLKLGIGWL